MRTVRYALHLMRRYFMALSRREPDPIDVAEVSEVLSDGEYDLWCSMRVEDRRHSIAVLRRFDVLVPGAGRAPRAAALLHDIGKVESDLGVLQRVAATLLGGVSVRFAAYHEHVERGARLLEDAGSDPAVVALVRGQGPESAMLRRADDTA